MKTTLKRSFKLGILILGISSLSINCEKDSISEQIEEHSNFVEQGENKLIKTGKFNDFYHLKEFVKELKNDKSSLNRSTLEESNDFTIIEENDIFIYTDSINTTYTLAIEKENQNNFEFSNLVVQFSNDNPTTAFILNYVPSLDYLNAYILNDQEPFQGTVNYQSIDYDGSLDNLAGRRICHTIKLSYCNYGGETHTAGENCTAAFIFEVAYDICYESNTDEPLNETIDPPSGQNSGGGGTNSNPTKPLPSKTCVNQDTGEVGIMGTNGDCFSAEALTISQQLEDILGENDSFIFDETINSNNALIFDSVEDFEIYMSDVVLEILEVSENTMQSGTFSTRFRVMLLVTTINININQKLKDESINQDYEILSFDTAYSGLTISSSWEQTSFEYVVFGNEAIVNLNGIINYNLYIDGIGTVYSDFKSYEMKINILTGEPISITEIED